MQMSPGRALQWLAEREADAVSIVFEGRALTRGEFDRRSNRLARAYADRGVGSGDLVTFLLPNGIELMEACLATWKLGATPQPLSVALPAAERQAIIALSDPALVVGAETGDLAEPGDRGDRPTVAAGADLGAGFADGPLPDRVSECVRAITSGGSTGRPKVVIDTRPALCDPEVPENRMVARGVTLCPGPLYHAGPFITAWQAVLSGGTAILMRCFDAEQSLALVERHRVDWVLFVPTMMQRIWRLPDSVRSGYDVSSLRVVMSSGAPCPVWLKRVWIDWLGAERIFEAYGGAERIGGTSITGTEWLEHPGSVGRPLPGRGLAIRGSAGQELPAGEVGEIYMLPDTGPGSTYRYLGAQPTAMADGWESLGDLGYMDGEGYLYIVDRKTDMIVSGGANVYAAEVEAAIDAHPAVRSSVVIGLPDADLGQRVHAIVEAPAGVSDDALRTHLAGLLSRTKHPRSFEYVDAPLRDDAGKVRRSALRAARIESEVL